MTRKIPMREAAMCYLASGLSLLPIAVDGSKGPFSKLLPHIGDVHRKEVKPSWIPFQTRYGLIEEIDTWIEAGAGIGIIGGRISGHLEILDFDAPALFAPWCEMVEELAPSLVQRLPLVNTPSDGRHLYYRCATIEGNQKLASAIHADGTRGDILMETRGEGGYVLSPLCPASCHELRKPYQLMDGDLTDIPLITPDERTLLLQAARSFNQYVEPERTIVHPSNPATTSHGDRPGDAYNARATWEGILTPHGWTPVRQRGEVTLWTRPGKTTRGWSATTGYGKDLLYVFSTNAVPFDGDTGYSKFAAYALLEHRGNYTVAAKTLYAQGYRGERTPAVDREIGYQGYAGYRPYRGYGKVASHG